MSTPPNLSLVPTPPADSTPAWKSRTLWLAAIGLLGKWIPGPVGDFLRANESTVTDLILMTIAGVRLDTKAGISFRF